jgi:cyclic beta-1,2-glucan synthetase
MTPAPWINVLANAGFGTVVSESGGSYTGPKTRTKCG